MLQNAPTLLAALDRNLVCRQASRGWLERLGRSAGKQALAMPLDALFSLEDQARLPDQLRDLLRHGAPLRELPVTLTGTSGRTRGLLSARRGEDETREFGEIIGGSLALKRTLAQIEAVAATPASVLVLGESGVGKEMIARAVHEKSDRADKPLVKVDCASIPKDLFESEFFGHVKGAFTGAHRDRVGRLQLAHGGTLFLDEVGEIPLSLQSKLLRALQEREFERIGDDRTIKVDVRVVAATNRDLETEVQAGRFREDLFYRLSVFPILVPPLRERPEDIAPLAQHFLERACAELGRVPMRLSQSQAESLERHRWPGNIRELKNVIERAVILGKSDRARLDLVMPQASGDPRVVTSGSGEQADFVTNAQIKAQEKANMIAALRHANWRIWGSDGAAELLGLKPSTLTYRMKVLGIRKEA